ncbi:putative ribonuclease H-like domain-containing protein [Tanacetum coccineum]
MINISEEHTMGSYIKKQRRTNHKDYQNCLFAYFLSQNEPKKVIQALTDPSWIEAMQEELLQFKLQKVWTLVDLPKAKRAIGTKWVYRNKKDERGIVFRNKARLVVQGYTQEEGIDYNEVFAPVARIEAIRLFLAHASFMGFIVYQIDVKSAFLYGTIEEEVYVCQPPSFEDLQFPDKVYKVEKALYGLHQAPRAWYETLSTYLLENGFRRGTIDKTLLIKKDKGNILLVQVYVDDIIFGSTKKSLCLEFEQIMHKRFQMSSMGELTFFLGFHTTSTPMKPNKELVKDEEADNVDVHLYRSMIGSLMYLTASRPDITFVVCACARFYVTLKVSHLHAVKRIFRYLKGQPKLALWYPRDSPFDLEAFSDSDYVGASLDRKSIKGGEANDVNMQSRMDGRTCNIKQKCVMSQTPRQIKRGQDTKIPQSSGPPKKVGDEAVHKELGDRMERAATTASSLEAEQDSDAQTRIGVDTARHKLNTVNIKGEGSAILVESHHTPISAPSTSQPPTSPPSIQTTHVAEEAAIVPHDSPLLRVYSLRSDEGSMTLNELTVLCTTLSKKVETLESDLKKTKLTYGAAYTKLITKVKKLKPKVKSSKARRRVRLVISDDEDNQEDPSKQGRKIAQIDEDERITLVQMSAQNQGRHEHDFKKPDFKFITPEEDYTAEPDISTANVPVSTASAEVSTSSPEVKTAAESLVYIKRSAAKRKDKGKAIMKEVEPVQKKTKLQLEQERLGLEEALRLQEQLEEEERQRMSEFNPEASTFNVKNGITYKLKLKLMKS